MASFFKKRGCQAVVFDMDGVLIDSEPIHFQVLNEMCAPLGFTITWEEFSSFIGKDEVTFWSHMIKQYHLTRPMEEYIYNYLKALEKFFAQAEKLSPIDGIVELLDELQEEGISIGLASSSAIKVIQDTIRALGITHYFDTMVGADQVGASKPDPKVYLKAMENLGVEPDRCGAIEDSHYGMLAAKASGAFSVAFYSPSSAGQDLSMADAFIHSIRELL